MVIATLITSRFKSIDVHVDLHALASDQHCRPAGLVARNLSVSAGNTGDGVKTEKQPMDFGKTIQSGLRGPLTEALAAYYVVRIRPSL